MSSERNSKLSDSRTIIIIGLIASLISICVFITGIQDLPDLIAKFSHLEETGGHVAVPTPFSISSQSNDVIEGVGITTIAQTPIFTPVPVSTSVPQVVKFANPGVSIMLHDGQGETNLRFTILSGGAPFNDARISISAAVQDIAGVWRVEGGGVGEVGGYTDANGAINKYLEPGIYAAYNDVAGQNFGTWGIEGVTWQEPNDVIIFPIEAGKTTEVLVSLAQVKVGFIQQGQALIRIKVRLYCQETDIAGNKVPSLRCEQHYYHDNPEPEANGIVTIARGAGTYIMEVKNKSTGETIYTKYDVRLEPGEVYEEIITIP